MKSLSKHMLNIDWSIVSFSKSNWADARRSKLRPIFRLISIILICVSAFISAHAAGFRVTGKISETNKDRTNAPTTSTWTFEVSVLDKQWMVASRSPAGDGHISGYDGSNTYSLLIATPDTRSRLHMSAYNGVVSDGPYPLFGPGLFQKLPWLAYCSGGFISSNATNGLVSLPAPWRAAWAMPLAHIYKSHYRPIPNGGGLPMSLDYFVDPDRVADIKNKNFHVLIPVDKNMEDQIAMKVLRESKIDGPVAAYEVLEITNFNGLTIPLKFSFEGYEFRRAGALIKGSSVAGNIASNRLVEENIPPDPSSAPTKMVKLDTPSTRMVGELISVETIDSLDPLPKASEGGITDIQVSDYRFLNPKTPVPFVPYLAKSSEWIRDKSDPRLTQLYASLSAEASARASRTSALNPILISVGFIFVIFAPLMSARTRCRIKKWFEATNSQ